MASVLYDYNANFIANYKNYIQSKATVAKNTMSAYISNARQKIVSPISITNGNDQKSETLNRTIPPSEIFISSIYAKQNNLNNLNQPKGTMLKLKDRIKVTIV